MLKKIISGIRNLFRGTPVEQEQRKQPQKKQKQNRKQNQRPQKDRQNRPPRNEKKNVQQPKERKVLNKKITVPSLYKQGAFRNPK